MKRIAALLCIAAMLITSTALAKQSNNGSENRERNRAQRVQQDKPKERVQNGNRQNERNRRQAYSKPRRKIQQPQRKKPKQKLSAGRNRSGRNRHHAYVAPRRNGRHASNNHYRRHKHYRWHGHQRKPFFSLLHWSWCSHGCH